MAIIAIVMIGVLLVACTRTNWTERQWDGTDIMGTDAWRLVELNGTPLDTHTVTIQVEELNLVGQGFCAIYRIAPVITTAGTIRIDQIASPHSTCTAQDTQYERDYFAALTATTQITRTADALVFSATDGQIVLRFVRL